MKSPLALLVRAVVVLAAGTGSALATRGSVPEVRISGHEYMSIFDWARRNGFEARWLRRDTSLQLTSSSAKVLLNIDSCEAEIKGIQVRLLFPVILRNGAPCLSQLDAQTTLQPILYPPAGRAGSRLRTICLDPGHGGKDPGFQVSGHDEKKYTLLLAQELRDQLARAGFKVSLTRSRDTFLELPDRPDLARRQKADLFVSLHFNAFPSAPASVQGAEVYCLTPAGAPSTNAKGEGGGAGWYAGNQYNAKNLLLAYQMQKALTQEAGVEDRAVHRARFAVLRDAVMPAVLVEAGYMSHPVEGKKIFDAGYRRQLARAMVDAIKEYERVTER